MKLFSVHRRLSLHVALVLVAIVAGTAAIDPITAQPAPPLPVLRPEAFPPLARSAIEAADRQARAHPSDPGAIGKLGMVLHAWEQWDAAHAAYQRARHLAPDAFEWHYLDAVVLQRLARHFEAAAALRRAVAVSPASLAARVRLAEVLFEAGERAETERLFAELAGDPRAAPVAAIGRARLAAAAGRHEEAVREFERAIGLFPEFGAAYYGLALSLRALGRRDEASAALRKHQQFGAAWPAVDDPLLKQVTSLKDDPRSVLQRALKKAEAGDLAAAIEGHEAALAQDPSLAQAHANLVRLYGRTGQWQKAEEHYRAVVRLGFNVDEAHYDYGVLLGLQGRPQEAASAYRRALAVNPRHAQAHNNLGQTLEQQGKVAEAEAHYRQAVESRPDFRMARFNLARMLLAGKRAAEAIPQLEKLRTPRDAEAPQYLFGLAVAYVHAGRRDEGIQLANEAKQLALEHGQTELATAIERELGRLR